MVKLIVFPSLPISVQIHLKMVVTMDLMFHALHSINQRHWELLKGALHFCQSLQKNKTCFNLKMKTPQYAEVTYVPSGCQTVVGACLQIPRDALFLLLVLLFRKCVYHNQLRHQLKETLCFKNMNMYTKLKAIHVLVFKGKLR